MSHVPASDRSFERITRADLRRLAEIEQRDRSDRFLRKPRWREMYSDRVLAVVLCQGAALHYVRGEQGINDLDVWTFYAAHPDAAFPSRWRLEHDFGDPKFGQSVDRPEFIGRRVDCISRSIPAERHEDPITAVRRYLKTGRSKTARLLAEKPVVLITPEGMIGEVIWPAGLGASAA